MTDQEKKLVEDLVVRFCKAAKATLHVQPNGYVTITTVADRKEPVITNDWAGQLVQAINDHARKIFA